MRHHVQADVAIERQCSATAVGYSGRIRSFGNVRRPGRSEVGAIRLYRFALSSRCRPAPFSSRERVVVQSCVSIDAATKRANERDLNCRAE